MSESVFFAANLSQGRAKDSRPAAYPCRLPHRYTASNIRLSKTLNIRHDILDRSKDLNCWDHFPQAKESQSNIQFGDCSPGYEDYDLSGVWMCFFSFSKRRPAATSIFGNELVSVQAMKLDVSLSELSLGNCEATFDVHV